MPDRDEGKAEPEAKKHDAASGDHPDGEVPIASFGPDATERPEASSGSDGGSAVDLSIAATFRSVSDASGQTPQLSVVVRSSGGDLTLDLRLSGALTTPSISVSDPNGVVSAPVAPQDDPALPAPAVPSPGPVPTTPSDPVTPGNLKPEMHQGVATCATFTKGSCGFPDAPEEALVGAMNSADFNGSVACGGCVRVYGPDGAVDVQIVDECLDCPSGSIDLNPAAFSRISSLLAGRVPISWHYIPCPVTGPISYNFSEACNPYWVAVQIRNHRHAISSVELLRDGAWVNMTREAGNYFTQTTSPGDGTVAFRVTDVFGSVLEDSGIALTPGGEASGAQQFPE